MTSDGKSPAILPDHPASKRNACVLVFRLPGDSGNFEKVGVFFDSYPTCGSPPKLPDAKHDRAM